MDSDPSGDGPRPARVGVPWSNDRVAMGRRLVLFDLDNTLVDRTATFFRWAAEFCAHHELNHPAALAWLIDEDGDGFRPREGFF